MEGWPFPFATSAPAFDPLEFVAGVFIAAPTPMWQLTFNRPITSWDVPSDPLHWATVKGVTTTPATSVSVMAGKIRIKNVAYTATDEQVIYAGPPPQYRDAHGHILDGFVHDLPS